MKTLAILAAALLLTACTDLPPISHAEGTYQALHLIDVVQTEHAAASDPCFYEADPVTSRLIGQKPSHAAVAAWGLGDAIVHYAVSSWLSSLGWTRTEAAWQLLTISDAGYSVGHNFAVGVRIGAPNVQNANCPYRDRPPPPTVFLKRP